MADNNSADAPDGAAVVLDGQGEQVEALQVEVSQKLDGLAKSHKIRPWTSRRYSDDMSVLEEHHDDENGTEVKDSKTKSRLEELFTTFKSNDDKHPTSRATFKPIKLAVARARYVEQGNTFVVPPALQDKKTTLVLPESPEESAPVSVDNNDDAASYLEVPQGVSPTITRTSSGSTAISHPESDTGVLNWLQKPFGKSNNSPTFYASGNVAADESKESVPTAGPSSGTPRLKRHSKKGSRVSSQGDLHEVPQAVDYAEIETTTFRRPKRSDTLLGMMPSSTDSFGYKRNNSLRLPIPFRGRRKRRKGKGKMVEDDSSSDEGIDDEELFQETLRQAGLFDKDMPEQVVTEALWQNERGLHLLGSRYGRNALLPGDPGSWTDLHGNATAYNISSFPLPTPAWQWHHAEWLVSMIGDVDSEGYQYSTRFSSKYWRGIPEIRFFVRRRLWIRTRYRPTLKAQTIAQLTRPQVGQAELAGVASQSGSQNHFRTTSGPEKNANGARSPLSPVAASQIDPRNPFISWYAIKADASPQIKGSDTENTDSQSNTPHKQEVIHANFVRVAKVLVRRTYVDRERLAWLEYWLGARAEPLHITDMPKQGHAPDVTGLENARRKGASNPIAWLSNIEEHQPPRPDVRDVWDLLEDQLDHILGVFEYQETRRELLILLKNLHNTSHSHHHYMNRSSSPDHPSEILSQHSHGNLEEMGADGSTRAKNGDGTHISEEERPRLAFWTNLESRLKDIQVTAGLPDAKEGRTEEDQV